MSKAEANIPSMGTFLQRQNSQVVVTHTFIATLKLKGFMVEVSV